MPCPAGPWGTKDMRARRISAVIHFIARCMSTLSVREVQCHLMALVVLVFSSSVLIAQETLRDRIDGLLDAVETADQVGTAFKSWHEAISLLDQAVNEREQHEWFTLIPPPLQRAVDRSAADEDTLEELFGRTADIIDRLATSEARAVAAATVADAWARAKSPTRSLRALNRARNEILSFTDAGLRAQGLRSVSETAIRLGDRGEAFIDLLLFDITAIEERGWLASASARARLEEDGIDPFANAELALMAAEAALREGANRQAGLIAAAMETSTPATVVRRNTVLSEAALGLISDGDPVLATLVAFALPSSFMQARVFLPLVFDSLEKDDVAAARIAALAITDPGPALDAWRTIGLHLHELGFARRADDAFEQAGLLAGAVTLDLKSDLATDLALSGRIATARINARRYAASDEDERLHRDRIHVAIACRQAASGQGAAAYQELVDYPSTLPILTRASEAVGDTAGRGGRRANALAAAALMIEGASAELLLRHLEEQLADDDVASSVAIDAMTRRCAAAATALIQDPDPAEAAIERVERALDGLRGAAAATNSAGLQPSSPEGPVSGGAAEDADRHLFGMRLAEDNPALALTLATSLSSEISSDAIRAKAALVIAQDGRLEEALDIIRTIKTDRLRVIAFRLCAENEAERLDVHQVLEGGQEPESRERQGEQRWDEVDRLGQYASWTTAGPVGGDRLPAVPDMSLSVDDLRASAPPISPGRLSLRRFRGAEYFMTLPGWRKFTRDEEGRRGYFIYLEDGVFDLRSVQRHVRAIEGDRPDRSDQARTFLFQLPILVGPDATLVVSGAESEDLRLSIDESVFLANAGSLWMLDTRITAWSEANAEPALTTYEQRYAFRPFIVSWINSSMNAGATTLTALGYQSGESYGFSYKSGPSELMADETIVKEPPRGILINNSFDNLYYGFYSYEIEDAAIVGNEYRNNVVYGIDPHDRSLRLKIGFNTAYGTEVKHGIIVSREVNAGWIVGNLSFDNNGSGFMLDRQSRDNLVYANVAFGNNQDGLSVYESGCSLIANNRFAKNGRSGLRVRNSTEVGVFQNHLAGNQGAGLDAYSVDLTTLSAAQHRDFVMDPFDAVTSVIVADNQFERNRSGINFREVDNAVLGTNVWLNQSPYLFTSDAAQLTAQVLSNELQGLATGIARICKEPRPVDACSFSRDGYFVGNEQASSRYHPCTLEQPSFEQASRDGLVQ